MTSSSSHPDKEALQKAPKPEQEKEEKKQSEAEKAHSKEKVKQEKIHSADALSPNAKTRNDAGFSLEQASSPEAGTIDASQAQQTAQLSRTQMVRGTDAALAAQARRLSPNVLVLLY